MGIDVAVVRVFTDEHGSFGNPLAIVDAAAVPPAHRQRMATELDYSETLFVDLPQGPESASTRVAIYTPVTELAFAGHPTVGVAWWLRERGTPIRTLRGPAGIVQVDYHGAETTVRARAEWAPDIAIEELGSVDELAAADPAGYPDDTAHYLWCWTDRDAGTVRARMFAASLGVSEDEATGSAALRLTELLSRDLRITQGRGSVLRTRWHADGWVQVGGRVAADPPMRVV